MYKIENVEQRKVVVKSEKKGVNMIASERKRTHLLPQLCLTLSQRFFLLVLLLAIHRSPSTAAHLEHLQVCVCIPAPALFISKMNIVIITSLAGCLA